MRQFGLTGGIASGKSTVSRMFLTRGVPVIDADQLARDAVAPGTPELEAISHRFPGVVDADGKLDRKALGQRIFSDPEARAALNAITHPAIRALAVGRAEALASAGVPFSLYDAPLLFENGLERALSGVVVVWCPRPTQLERLMRRDGLTAAEAEARLASQLPLDEKRARAQWVIDNSGALESTEAQVERVIELLARFSPAPADTE